jgi:putative Holliday junction resolvase
VAARSPTRRRRSRGRCRPSSRGQEADLIVVGLPLGLSGQEGDQARIAKRFRDDLAALLEVPVVTYDERLTTRMAERSVREGATGPADSIAAAHLLESYMERRGRQETAG